jgi:ferric-dicitrate binding protein FerR (iron transport regulator)
VAVLILLLTGLGMIRSGWAALRDPKHTRFWTDSTGLWLTRRLLGNRAAEKLDQRLHEESRIKRQGIVGIVVGTFFVIAAAVVVVLLALSTE